MTFDDDVTACPNCETVIRWKRIAASGQCPTCSVPIAELFAIAQGDLEPRTDSTEVPEE